METSLRYGGGDSKKNQVKIHAKQKLQIDHSNTLLQLNGELNTRTGAPTFLCALVRHFYPDLSASVGAGLHYDKNEKVICTLRGKKAYPMTFNRSVNVVLKGRCDIDKELTQPTPHGALELVWNILDFQKDQDVRLKVGYEFVDKIPYAQIRENNWTFNADITGRWNVRYNL
ncbi:outer envelope pore protein 21B, chloroplastic-like [Bidens hawaiensis]|uniref:outer envelope pore protein 21B, chloroplastic-like n=1 Tax=Bidens hawaiensis TaxID=980011 RepID=UPI004049BFBD